MILCGAEGKIQYGWIAKLINYLIFNLLKIKNNEVMGLNTLPS